MQPLPPSSYSVYDAYEFAKSHGAPFVQLRSGKIVRLADWPTFRDASHVPLHVVPGSFNPLHKGHMAIFLTLPLYELSDYGDRSMFRNVPGDPRSGMGMRAFELSISTVDKEPMSAEEFKNRLAQFVGKGDVIITNAPTFEEKITVINDSSTTDRVRNSKLIFHIGADTARRLYNHVGAEWLSMAPAIFVVYPRNQNGEPVPYTRHRNFWSVPDFDPAVLNYSSTAIRNGSMDGILGA